MFQKIARLTKRSHFGSLLSNIDYFVHFKLLVSLRAEESVKLQTF